MAWDQICRRHPELSASALSTREGLPPLELENVSQCSRRGPTLGAVTAVKCVGGLSSADTLASGGFASQPLGPFLSAERAQGALHGAR